MMSGQFAGIAVWRAKRRWSRETALPDRISNALIRRLRQSVCLLSHVGPSDRYLKRRLRLRTPKIEQIDGASQLRSVAKHEIR
jgi:hypothetical protein